MNRFPRFQSFPLAALLACTLPLLPSLENEAREAAPAAGQITKVNHHYLTEDAKDQLSVDPMIRFERRYLLHGANTLAEQRARYGDYFSIFWEVADRGGPVAIRFEYRQQNTGPAVNTREIEVLDVKRRNVTKFAVTGEDYSGNGKVAAWRASVVREGEVLAAYESFLWD